MLNNCEITSDMTAYFHISRCANERFTSTNIVLRWQLISVDGIVLVVGFLFFLIDRILVHGSVWRLIHHPKLCPPTLLVLRAL